MSFPRAKITRFNDIPPSSPSPAEYNVSHNGITPGRLIPKAGRFHDKSPAGSENGSQKSIRSTPLFRTPTLPKKKRGIFGSLRKPKIAVELNDPQLDLEVLKEKITECNNKDAYIQDLTEQIEEMRGQLSLLEQQKVEIREGEKLAREQLTGEIRSEHAMEVDGLCRSHASEVSAFRVSLAELEESLRAEKCEVAELRERCEKLELVQFSVDELRIELQAKVTLVESLEAAKVELEERLKQAELLHSEELHAAEEKHREEMVEMEYTMLKSVSEVQAALDKEKTACEKRINQLTREFEAAKTQLIEEANARVVQVEEDCKEANLLAEMQMQEKCKDMELTWKLKLESQEKEAEAILRECQTISEYNIIQSEIEKNTIRTELEGKLKEIEALQKSNADLMIAYKKLELQYADLEEEIEAGNAARKAEVESFDRELQEVVNQKKLYEISIQKSHQTIDTLKKRLLDSDRDVEQLKEEMEICELSKLEYEGKCNQLTEELELVAKCNEDMELHYAGIVKKTEARIQSLKTELIKKVDDFNNHRQLEAAILTEELLNKDRLSQEILAQLHQQQHLTTQAEELIITAHKEIDDFHTRNASKNLELCRMRLTCEQTRKQSDELLETIEKLQNENKDLLEKLDAVQEVNVHLRDNTCEEVENLEKKVLQLQEKSEQYSQYCDYYKVKAGEYEREIEELEGINKKYIDQSGKYDDLLQKYELLEKENAALKKKGNKELELKVRNQTRTIEKLRKELTAMTISPRKSKLPAQDKENVSSPNRTNLNGSRIESPGPLRDRN